MGRLVKYILILSVVLLLFHFAGLIEDTPISVLLQLLTNPSNLRNSSLFAVIFAATQGVIAGVAITIGVVSPSRVDFVIKVGIVSFLISIGWDLVAIANKLALMNSALAVLIVSPLMVVYLLTAIEWWFGRD